MSEHCEHCADECRNGDIPYGPRKDHYNEGECAVWERENCPACAERAKVEAEIVEWLKAARGWAGDDQFFAGDLADMIERGDHLEADHE